MAFALWISGDESRWWNEGRGASTKLLVDEFANVQGEPMVPSVRGRSTEIAARGGMHLAFMGVGGWLGYVSVQRRGTEFAEEKSCQHQTARMEP